MAISCGDRIRPWGTMRTSGKSGEHALPEGPGQDCARILEPGNLARIDQGADQRAAFGEDLVRDINIRIPASARFAEAIEDIRGFRQVIGEPISQVLNLPVQTVELNGSKCPYRLVGSVPIDSNGPSDMPSFCKTWVVKLEPHPQRAWTAARPKGRLTILHDPGPTPPEAGERMGETPGW